MLHKTATNEDKQQFYDAHNKCSNTKVSSPKVKEFFAAQETLRYIEQHTSRQQAHEIGSLIDTDTSSDDEQITPQHTIEQEHRTDWEELLVDLTPKETEADEAAVAVEDLLRTEPALIPGNDMKALSSNALKDSLNKERAINKALRAENESLKTKVEEVRRKEKELALSESVIQSTQAVLEVEAKRQSRNEQELKELEATLSAQQHELQSREQHITQKEQKFNKAQEILNNKYKEFKALKSTSQTYKIHVPIKQNRIAGDPIIDETCFSNLTCGHIKINIQDSKINTVKWNNNINIDRALTNHQKESSDEDDFQPPPKKMRH